ncbi:MAG: hypothetical protein V1914_04240 [archaeon]
MKLKKGLKVILEDMIEVIPSEFRSKDIQGYCEFWIYSGPQEIFIETPSGGITCSLPGNYEYRLNSNKESEYAGIKIRNRKKINRADLVKLINRSTNNRKELAIYSHGIDDWGHHKYSYLWDYIKDEKRDIWVRAKTNPRFYYGELSINIAESICKIPKKDIEKSELLRGLYSCFKEPEQ